MKKNRQKQVKERHTPNHRITVKVIRQTALDVLCYLIGSAVYAFSVNAFSAPNKIAPGGLTGVATVLNYLIPDLPIGVAIFVMNIPLLIACWFHGGRSFTVRTVLCTLWVSLLIDLTESYVPVYHGDPILVAVFGGVLMGIGLGLIYMRGASTGGSEIAARLMERRMPFIPIGRLILLVDGFVVALAAFVFRQVDAALYAIIMIFVSSRLMDAMIYGGTAGKLVMIISKEETAITQAILTQMNRGVTRLSAQGGYSGGEKPVILCAVQRTQMYSLRRLVARIDPEAFLIITTTDEVLGNGFKSTIEDG